MHSVKTPHRGVARPRHNQGTTDQFSHRNHNDLTQMSKVNALEGAARAANLKLLLAKANNDLALLSAAAQVKMPRLQQMIDGQELVGSELATHIEETLALDQGWLDRKHELEDISERTINILLGKETSDFENDIRHVEQKGHDLMKNASTQPSSSAKSHRPPAIPSDAGNKNEAPSSSASSGRATSVEDLPAIRVANLTLLTQARGAKSKLARTLQVSESIVSFLFNGKKAFSSEFARDFESKLGLPKSWLDWEHTAQDVPNAVWQVLGEPGAAATPTSTAKSPAPKAKPKAKATPKHHAQGSLALPALKLNVQSEPSILGGSSSDNASSLESGSTTATSETGAQLGASPSADTSGAMPPEASQGNSAPASAPAASTTKAQSAKAPAGKPAGAASKSMDFEQRGNEPTQRAGSGKAEGSRSAPTGAPTSLQSEATESHDLLTHMNMSTFDGKPLGPITEALVKTLLKGAKDGTLSEKNAYDLLGTVAGLQNKP